MFCKLRKSPRNGDGGEIQPAKSAMLAELSGPSELERLRLPFEATFVKTQGSTDCLFAGLRAADFTCLASSDLTRRSSAEKLSEWEAA